MENTTSITGLAVAKHNHSVDYFGVAIDVRKSDVQKAIRRGVFQQAASSFFAGFNMLELFPGNKTALAIQTNFINRLIIIAVEDVGLANPALLRTILPILHGMSKNKVPRDPDVLASIVLELVNSPKSRLCSHLFNGYKKTNRKLAVEKGVVFSSGSTINLETPDCFGWIEDQTPEEIFDVIHAHPRCKPFLTDFILMAKIHKTASKFGKPNMIRYILGLAHYLSVPDTERGQFVTAEMQRVGTVMEGISSSVMVPLLLNDPVIFLSPLDDSADVHTAEGRKAGHDSKRFRQTGALVENAHRLMNDSILECIYLAC